MRISRERLAAEAQTTGFRPEVLEEVIHLLSLLEGFQSHPFLKGRLALKGGTALNLFHFDLPRLSVDIDLNYIGAVDRDEMLEERPKVEQAVQAVFSREGMHITRVPTDHAGGKWRLRYDSALGQSWHGQGGTADLRCRDARTHCGSPFASVEGDQCPEAHGEVRNHPAVVCADMVFRGNARAASPS